MKALPQQMFRHLRTPFAICALLLGAVCTHAPQAAAQGTGYWHTSGGKIIDGCGNVTRINGISWYGFESTNFVINDLWGSVPYTTIMQEIKSNGFNTIRIPWSNQLVENQWGSAPVGSVSSASGLAGDTSGQVFDAIIAEAGTLGLKVILDNHSSDAGSTGNEPSGLWYTPTYSEANWITDWQFMINRYAAPGTTYTDANGNPTVIGVDIRNEPHLQNMTSAGGWNGSCWTGDTTSNNTVDPGCPAETAAGAYSSAGVPNDHNWPSAAERGAAAVLAINPNLLIFVQGVDAYDNQYRFAGGNLLGASVNTYNSTAYPVTLSVPNQLVYSAHDYGPSEYAQNYLNNTSANSYSELVNNIWDPDFGNLTTGSNPVPVWIGEFGTPNANPADYACYPAGSTCTVPYPTSASPDLQVDDTVAGSEGLWFNTLITYLKSDPVGENLSWSYWALNEEDPFGLLDTALTGVALPAKETALQSIENSPQFTGDMCPGPTNLTITGETSSSIFFAWDAPATAIPNMQGYVALWAYGQDSNLVVPYNSSVESEDAPYATGYIPATTTSSSVGPIGLSPYGAPYSFMVAAVEPGGVLSAPTNIASGTTDSIYGCTTPIPPANFTATATSSSQITLNWTADPLPQLGPENTPCSVLYLPESVAVGAQYFGGDEPNEQYPNASVLGSTTGTSYAVTGLNASTEYCYTALAALQNSSLSEGNPYWPESFQENAICATTQPPAAVAAVNVVYTVTSTTTSAVRASTVKSAASTASNSFQANISIADESATPITNWTASFSFPGSQIITSVSNATTIQSGSVVVLNNDGSNATIPAKGSVSGIGFSATGTAATPTFITVNGQPASINGVKPTVATLVPAPAPTALSATRTSGTSVQLTWSAVAPTPATPSITYQVYRSTTSGFTPGIGNLVASGLTTPTYSDSNLAVSTTYYYVVAAADAVGSNGYSPQASATTQAQSNYCHIAYALTTSWPSGSETDFQSSVTIDNIGKTSLSSWTIGWQFPNTTTSITSGDVWNGNLLTNSGGKESISNVSYNGSISAGGSYTFSFQGSYTGTNANPTAFTVNGVACQ